MPWGPVHQFRETGWDMLLAAALLISVLGWQYGFLLKKYKQLPEKLRRQLYFLFLPFFGCLISFVSYVGIRQHLEARIIVASDQRSIYCRSWRDDLLWEHVTNIELSSGIPFTRLRTRMLFSLDPASVDRLHFNDYIKSRRKITCRIDGLDAWPGDIYDVAVADWRAAQERQKLNASRTASH